MDDLILAALKRRDVAARERFKAALDSIEGRAEEKLLGLFDVLGVWVRRADFTGRLFINATAEFADHRAPIHQAAKASKGAYRAILTDRVA